MRARPRMMWSARRRRGGRTTMSPLLELQTFVPPDIEMVRRDDGSIVLASRHPQAETEPSISAVLRRRAAEHPERPLAAQRDAGDRWVTLTYGEAQRQSL